MYLAGCVAQDACAEDEVWSSLRILSLTGASNAEVVSTAGYTCGVTDGAALWRSSDSNLIAAFAGRLFDRSSVVSRLKREQADSDARLIAEAYLRWGDVFAGELYGEFACAVWDARSGKLILSRDALGRVPLYFAQVSGSLRFASEVIGLTGTEGAQPSLDFRPLAFSLSLQSPPSTESDRTIFRGIRIVSPGHAMVVNRGGDWKKIRTWNPLRQPQLKLSNTSEYAEALRDALWRAVEVRLPQRGLVASQLSSGFDSSGVSAIAAQILARQNRHLLAYTSVPSQAVDASAIVGGRFSDEWPLASEVAAMYPNLEHIRVRTDAADWWESLDKLSDAAGGSLGFIRNSRWLYGILRSASERGAVTMLEGQAGNLTSSYNGGFALYDLRKRQQWLHLARVIRQRKKAGASWPAIYGGIFMPSARQLYYLQRLRGRRMNKTADATVIRPEFFARAGVSVGDISNLGSTIEGDRSNGASWRYSILSGGDMGMASAIHRRIFDLQRDDPTADQRLTELCLSIPDEAFAPNGVPRDLYRMAFRNDLPPNLLNQRGRGLQSSDFLEMFRNWLPEVYAEIERLESISEIGECIDLPRMRLLVDQFEERVSSNRAVADTTYNYTVGGALALGRYLRRLRERGVSIQM